MTADLEILQHTIGADTYGKRRSDRNHFVTGAGSTDHPICVRLVECGLMTQHGASALSGGDDVFSVTRAGREYVATNSPKPPPLPPAWLCLAPWNDPLDYSAWFTIHAETRSKARYAAYRMLREFNDLPGREMVEIRVKRVQCAIPEPDSADDLPF